MEDESAREALREVVSNSKLSEHFLALARDLDVMEAKMPEDVYKTHLVRVCDLGRPGVVSECGRDLIVMEAKMNEGV